MVSPPYEFFDVTSYYIHLEKILDIGYMDTVSHQYVLLNVVTLYLGCWTLMDSKCKNKTFYPIMELI